MQKASMITGFAAFMVLTTTALHAGSPLLAKSLIAINSASQSSRTDQDWVSIEGKHFVVDGRSYAYVGANLWYGANLGADDRSGDRPRLLRELDRLALLGIGNLRIMAGSEGPDSEPYRIVPALQPAPHVYNAAVLHGLDFLLSEMGKRHMRAILCLNNYWQWSGGMAQYVSWNGAGPIPYPPPAAHGDWERYKAYTEQFYTNTGARRDFARHIQTVVTRRNSITGRKYADDPTIMTWELANEPVPPKNVTAFVDWVNQSAALIKSLDHHHLVISGGEDTFLQEQGELPDIDYASVHIWVQNNGWYDPMHPAQTYPGALARAQRILAENCSLMNKIGKPLVLAEFGLARDDNAFDAGSPTTYRDDFYRLLLEQTYLAARDGESLVVINFWAWNGEGRARVPGGPWQSGDALLGDPPHEPQGWYGVYDEDVSTLALLQSFAFKMSLLSRTAPYGQRD